MKLSFQNIYFPGITFLTSSLNIISAPVLPQKYPELDRDLRPSLLLELVLHVRLEAAGDLDPNRDLAPASSVSVAPAFTAYQSIAFQLKFQCTGLALKWAQGSG